MLSLNCYKDRIACLTFNLIDNKIQISSNTYQHISQNVFSYPAMQESCCIYVPDIGPKYLKY